MYAELSQPLQRAMDLNSEKGSSSWLTVLPFHDQGFHLNKHEFRDATHQRYGWTFPNIPDHCVCGESFSPNHAMIFHHGGLTFMRLGTLQQSGLIVYVMILLLSCHYR